MFKNVAGQKWRVYAFNRTNNQATTGDAANITAKVSLDYGTYTALTDVNPTELESGYYEFDLTQAETNGDVVQFIVVSSTTDINVIGQPERFDTSVDVSRLAGDATAGTNIKNQYDGTTGLSGDPFPSTQAAVKGIGSGTAGAINFEAQEDNTGGAIKGASFVGSVVSGTLDDTSVEDGVSYTIEDTVNDIDMVVGFDVGGAAQAVEVEMLVNLNGNGDRLEIRAYDFDASGWDEIGFLDGSGGAAFKRLNLSLLGRHTGTGADLGKVYIRYERDTTTPASLEIDKIIVGAVQKARSVGYSNGSVWIDTLNGISGTESFVNGVGDNPVSSYSNATTIAGNVGLSRYTFTSGDNITITQGHSKDSFFGYNYHLDTNNQAPPTYVEGAEIVGICNGTSAHYVRDCRIGTTATALTLNQGCVFVNSGLVNVALKDAAAAALDVEFLDCHGNTQGSMFPGGVVDFGTTAGTNHEVSFQRWGGPVTIKNLKDGDTVYAHGNGTFILDSSCTGGSFRVAGMINLVNNSGGAVSVLEDGRITRSGIATSVLDKALTDHQTVGTLGKAVSDIETDAAASLVNQATIEGKVDTVDANVDTALVNQATIEGKIDTVDTNVDTALVNQTNIEGKVDTVDTNVDTALVNQATIEGKVDVVDTNVDTALVNQATIEGKVDTVDTNVDTALVNQATITSKVDVVDANVDTSLLNQATIEGKVDVVDTNVDTALVNQATIEGKIDTVDANVDQIVLDTAQIITAQATTDGKVDVVDGIVDAIKAVTDEMVQSAQQIRKCSVDTVVNGHTPTSTVFQTDSETSAVTDAFKNRRVLFTSGNLQHQPSSITASVQVGGITQITVSPAFTQAPANDDTFLIL